MLWLALLFIVSPELQAHMLGEFAAGEDRYSIIVRGNKADSLGRFRDVFVPVVNLFDTLVSSLGGSIEFDTLKLERGVYEIEAVTDVSHIEPKVGDISRGGVHCHQLQRDKQSVDEMDKFMQYLDDLKAATNAVCISFSVLKNSTAYQKRYGYRIARTVMIK